MDKTNTRKNKPLVIISTLLIMYVITGLALLALALLLFKMQLSENIVSNSIMVIYIISCLIGGLVAGRRLKVRRFLWGVAVGAVYFAVLLIGSLLMNRGISSNAVHVVTTVIMCMAAGMIGGMIS